MLGKVLTTIFRPAAIMRMKMVRTEQTFTARELQKTADATITTLGKFTGDKDKAPRWIHEYCSQVYRYDYPRAICFDILVRCFTNEAKSWLDMNLTQVSHLADKQLEQLILLFVTYFMGNNQRDKWRIALSSLKLSAIGLTHVALRKHYEQFVNIANNLQLCEPTYEDGLVLHQFVNSLPMQIRMYMGPEWKKAATIDELMRMSEDALTVRVVPATAHGGIPRTNVPVNVLQDLDDYVSVNAATTTEDYNRKSVMCYHCGKTGHYTGCCPIINQRQSLGGANAWTKRAAARGREYPYDKEYYIQQQAHYESGKDYSSFHYVKNNNNNNVSSSPSVSAYIPVPAVSTSSSPGNSPARSSSGRGRGGKDSGNANRGGGRLRNRGGRGSGGSNKPSAADTVAIDVDGEED